MCKPQCLVVFVLISINYVNSWDIALTVGDQLEFRNGSKIISEGARFRDLTALAYDAVYNMLLFVDRQSDNASIFSYNLATKKYQPLVKRKSFENIQGIAFDPITSSLFWTDTNEKSIYWKSLKPGAKNDIYGKSLFKMVDEIPRAVAVDSCRGYLYWTNTNVSKPTIERSRFDGTEREVIISSGLYMPVSIAIDQKTKTLYWADDRQGIHYSIDSSDLDGKNVRNIMEGTHHQPNTLAVSKDSLYWVDFGYRSVWQYPKNPIARSEPAEIDTYFNEMPFGIVANYEIPDQTAGVSECQGLAELAKNKAAINDTFHIPIDIGLYCLHGTKIDGTLNCKCSAGYTGERCEIMICQNYCFNGLCSLSPEGEPKCSCNNGYAGSRCEKNICDGYCLNQGSCSTRGQKPYCACSEGYEGQRCEIQKNGDGAKDEPEMRSVVRMQSEICNCSNEQNTTSTGQALEVKPSETVTANDGEFIETNNCIDGWDPIRDPIIMVLGILSGLLCMGCAVLITTILKLKKRPRIKKRIIVNKNVTPLTARPDQCEITIENCCNMNICETPCFEPRSTIRPTLLDSKPGKEEKKNLIANMEYPDDY